jgi:hypothetical protein
MWICCPCVCASYACTVPGGVTQEPPPDWPSTEACTSCSTEARTSRLPVPASTRMRGRGVAGACSHPRAGKPLKGTYAPSDFSGDAKRTGVCAASERIARTAVAGTCARRTAAKRRAAPARRGAQGCAPGARSPCRCRPPPPRWQRTLHTSLVHAAAVLEHARAEPKPLHRQSLRYTPDAEAEASSEDRAPTRQQHANLRRRGAGTVTQRRGVPSAQ